MASNFEDNEIRQGRASLQSIAEKSETLRRSGGTLDANGEPKLTDDRGGNFTAPPSGGDQGSSARSSLRGSADLARDPRLTIPTSDAHITGSVGGKENGRPAQTTWGERPGPKKKEEAMLRPTKLNQPASRSIRPANADGATSFHFSHEAISKTRFEKTTARGTKNRKGAASDHSRYLERDEAVARTDGEQIDKIEADLLKAAANDPELARQLGLDKADIEKAVQGLAENATDALGVGGMASVYIEREEALAHNDNGIAVLFSNISENAAERRDFWKLVEQNESDPSDDKMQLLLKGNEEFWLKVAADDDCPKKLKQAIAAAKPDEITVVRTRDNQLVREIMKRHGWKPREKRKANETDEERAAREEREAASSFGARFEDGRGGRVQFRIVGELPYEVDHEARVRILKGFTEEFERRNLPFIAVMHAPDHTNDDRNWHFHLVYHDRPAKRFTAQPEDHLQEPNEKAGPKKQRQHEIAEQAINDPAIRQHVGQWDFTVPWTYRKPNRHMMKTNPFEQQKDREVTRASFIPTLRRQLANLTNNELAAAGVARRLDPRRYDQMGIEKEADEHLGTQASRFESLGVPTEKGLRNELNQWAYVQSNLEEKKLAAENRIDKQLKRWNIQMDAVEPTEQQRAEVEREMVRWEQAARIAAEHRAIADNIEQHYERLKSRALKVKKVAEKHVTAIEEKRATRRQSANLDRYRAKLEEANIHLVGLEILMAQEIAQIANSQAAAKRHEDKAQVSSDVITTILKTGAEQRAEFERTYVPKPANENAKVPAPANDTRDAAKKAAATAASKMVDQFIKSNMRLIKDFGVIVPSSMTREEFRMIGTPEYAVAQKRLVKIKAEQDRQIEVLNAALRANPGMLKAKDGPGPFSEGHASQDCYRLGTSDRTLQAIFSKFGNDYDVRAQITAIEAAKTAAAAARVAEPKQAEHAAETVAPKPAEKPAPVANDNEKIIDAIRNGHLRPAIKASANDLTVEFSKTDASRFDLKEIAQISDPQMIKRIEGAVRTNERAIKRVLAYIEKQPGKVIEGKAGAAPTINPRAPKELVEIAANFSQDPALKQALENAVIEQRLKAAEAKTNEAKAKPAKGGPDTRKPTDTQFPELSDNPEDWKPRRASQPYVPEPVKPKTEKPEREGVVLPADAAERAKRFERATDGRTYKTGTDPVIDQWIEAHLAGERDKRRQLAAKIDRDKRLRELADKLEQGLRETFEADRETNRQAGRHGGPERGLDLGD
ncbi:MobA/MobL family protein [Croceicoccus gelatinilyticus]|uniref:MobA/MobL family protein n=1 Tax=Croceicoccus gelatinilyticus TaxID=2835536 RepID=UPI001BD0E13B|nr:MobA/MobL family protein [Croceicoccus gelatinilyticus]MBS7671541.1 MobA/MobL family protein [Croceicoccus gelatinilyticus]